MDALGSECIVAIASSAQNDRRSSTSWHLTGAAPAPPQSGTELLDGPVSPPQSIIRSAIYML